jgi:hypothetical protein
MPPSASPLAFLAASTLKPRALEWFWPGRLAFGKLAVLDGDPGLGKSFLTLDLCARLSTGRALPDGAPGPSPACSLVLNCEDGLEDTLAPRLAALKANLDRIFVIPRDQDVTQPLRFPSQIHRLDQALTDRPARLVVIDPVMAFLDEGILSGSDQSVRRALYPLACLAEKHRAVILLVRHLNKTSNVRAVYRGGGSIGFIGASRSAWLVAPSPQDHEIRVLAQIKNNLGPPQPSLAFRLKSTRGGRPSLRWLGTSPLGANQLLMNAPKGAPPAARDRACDFLTDFLGGGPRTSREVWDISAKHRLSSGTLRRAKKCLEIRTELVEREGIFRNYWLLPFQHLSPTPKRDDPNDLEHWLGPLRERYPPSTPLDDL